MIKDLIIIGAGGDGKNVAELVAEMSQEWSLLGFLDDDAEKQGEEINGVRVLGTLSEVDKYTGCHFVVLIGAYEDIYTKKNTIEKLTVSADKYATIIHSSAWVSSHASIGGNSMILPGVTIMANAEIGNHVFIASKSNIGHDTKIRDYVTIAPMAAIAGNVIIDEGSYIGLGSSIKDGIIVGKWSIVGMGSVVVRDVPPYHVVAGNPAKILRKIDAKSSEM